MTREELLNSPTYWTTKAQIELFNKVEEYMSEKGINRTQLATELGVSKGYISQILNGNCDHRLSKVIELAVKCGYAPTIVYESLNKNENIDNIVKEYKSNFERRTNHRYYCSIMTHKKDSTSLQTPNSYDLAI